jgi:ketosteroid isomerase-like protein
MDAGTSQEVAVTDVAGTEDEVREAAAALVAAFGAGALEAYFGAFAPDATFVFHTTDRVLESVEAYRREWARWEEEDGFRVLSCSSVDQRVQPLGDVAVFTHRVRTRVATTGGELELRERETIVFRREATGRWVAVHEHLSPDPAVPA